MEAMAPSPGPSELPRRLKRWQSRTPAVRPELRGRTLLELRLGCRRQGYFTPGRKAAILLVQNAQEVAPIVEVAEKARQAFPFLAALHDFQPGLCRGTRCVTGLLGRDNHSVGPIRRLLPAAGSLQSGGSFRYRPHLPGWHGPTA